jgi:hypothetical protein
VCDVHGDLDGRAVMGAPVRRDWSPERLDPVEVVCWRNILVAHANDLVLGVCIVCQAAHCPAWRAAYDRLAGAGELMRPLRRWQGMADVDRNRPRDRRQR